MLGSAACTFKIRGLFQGGMEDRKDVVLDKTGGPVGCRRNTRLGG